MAITFTDAKALQTSYNQVLWNNQSLASLSFFFRYETAGTLGTFDFNLVGRFAGKGVFINLINGSAGNVTVRADIEGHGTQSTSSFQLAQGVIYHLALTHDGITGAQTFWVNGTPHSLGTWIFDTEDFDVPFQLGGAPGTSPCVYTIQDVALWNGYVLTSTDIANLRDGIQRPSQIGAAATLRAEWTLAGIAGETPVVGDPGLSEVFGDTTYDLDTITGAGSAVYSTPLVSASSVTFTDAKAFQTSYNQALWNNQSLASLSFFFRYETAGALGTFGSNLVGRYANKSMYISLTDGSAGNVTVRADIEGHGTQSTSSFQLAQGSTYHLALTHDGITGAQTFWINGAPHVLGTWIFDTEDFDVPFQLGGAPGTSPCVYTIRDVAIWNGYVLTSTDIANLRDGVQLPMQIGGSATLRAEWTLAGITGNTPTLGDIGLGEAFGDTTYDLDAILGSGSAVYSAPLFAGSTAGVKSVYVGTSGKTVVFIFENTTNSVLTTPIAELATPTISKNGTSLGSLTNLWLTGHHNCAIYCLPTGYVISPGDTVTVTAPTAWMDTQAGVTQGMSDVPVLNLAGKSSFGTESLAKTLKLGLNFPHLGTYFMTLYQVPRNWRYRLGWFTSCSHSADGKPISWAPNSQYPNVNAAIHSTREVAAPGGNLLDSTAYAGLPGLYAVCWDDLNTASPTDFFLDPSYGSYTTISERRDLLNTGTAAGGGRTNGIVRVFDVQVTTGSPLVSLDFDLRVQNASQTPNFDNLFIVGPGDFTYQADTPTVIDRSNPYALSSIFLNRLAASMGSARWLDSTIDFGGSSRMSEPESLRSITDFSWDESNVKVSWSFGYDQARAYTTSASSYVYSTLFGTPYTATLASDIDSVTTSLTISDAATAPVLAGLTLTIDSEVMRVLSVSGTTVTVSRGAESTTPASHSGTPRSISVNKRLLITSLSQINSQTDARIFELVTHTPHRLKTGDIPDFSGSFPTFTFTDGSTLSGLGGQSRCVIVTGPNSFLTTWGGATGGPVTMTSTPVSLDYTQCTTQYRPVSIGFPYEFIALATSQLPGCDLQVNVPYLSSNTMVDTIARLVRDNFASGRNIWIELSDEPWDFGQGFPQFEAFKQINNLAYPGQDFYTWCVVRTSEIRQRFVDRFNEGGRNRGGEIKCMINVQSTASNATSILNVAVANNADVDAIAMAPYINPDRSSASITAWNAADDEQAIDLWIHDLYYNTQGWPSTLSGFVDNINAYNTANGKQCVLYGYEGGLSETTPGDYITERNRDMAYNPNWYIIEQDMYAFFQKYGFSRINLYAYDMAYVGQDNWALYHWIGQPYGRGDGSDGKVDNRLCLATPGKPHTKSASINQDQTNVSVRGLAFLDWMRAANWTSTGSARFNASRFGMIKMGGGGTYSVPSTTGVSHPRFNASSFNASRFGGPNQLVSGGSVTLGELVVAGAGMMTTTADSSILNRAISASGIAIATVTGSGSIVNGSLSVPGLGVFKTTSTGPINLPRQTVSGDGELITSAANSINLRSITVAGSGLVTFPATGDITTGTLIVAGTSEGILTADASITCGAMTAEGASEFLTSASVSNLIGAIVTSGIGSFDWTASGDVSLGSITAAGICVADVIVTGDVTTGIATASGVGFLATTGNASLLLSSVTVAGIGSTTGAVNATGSLTLVSLSMSGSGNLESDAVSDVTLGSVSIANHTTFTTTSSDQIDLGSLTIDSTGVFKTSGTGNVTLAIASVSGVGEATGDILVFSDVILGALTSDSSGAFTTTSQASILMGLSIVDGSAIAELLGSGQISTRIQASGVASVLALYVTANPGSVRPSSTTNVMMVGTNTRWTANTPSFAISGVSGTSISAQSIQDDTHVLLSVTTGLAHGVATITDNLTGLSAPLAIKSKRISWAPMFAGR